MKGSRPVMCALLILLAGCSKQPESSDAGAPDSGKAAVPAEDWLTASRRARAQNPHPIEEGDIAYLKQLGLKDPIRDLITDLQKHPEVLPFQPSKGASQFGFYDSTQIRVLTGDWVYAYTEDGHASRPVLLRYQVKEGGRIEWKVVATDGGE